MASIQRRVNSKGDETWRVGYREGGKLKWSRPMSDPAGAAELKTLIERLGGTAALAIQDQRQGRDTARGVPLLFEWFEKHLTALEADATPGTIAGYREMARRTWLPSLGPLPIDAVTADAVRGWIAEQRKTETARSARARAKATEAGTKPPAPSYYSAKSIRNAHGLLSSVLESAVGCHLLRNEAKGLRLPSDQEHEDPEIFSENEIAEFIEAMQPHYRPLVTFLAATGIRIGEATALQVHDFDLEAARPIVRIRRAWKKGETGTYLGSPKSKRGRRTIVLPPELRPILRPLLENRAADDLVFTAAQGGQIHAHRFRERQWQAALDKAGIDRRLTPHSLRHSAASFALLSGVSPIVVQNRLGHESLDTTSKVYAHLLTGAQDEAAAVAGRFISGGLPQIES